MLLTRQGYCLRTLADPPAPVARLVCLPHSGGAAASYAPWAEHLRPDIQLLAVQYPGHGDRFGEAAPGDVRAMSAELVRALAGLDPVPAFVFGHSLGALVAYESALALAARGCPPSGLLVSSCAAPGRSHGGRAHLQSDDDLWSAACAMGGIDPAAAGNAELAEVLLPVLRSDITAHERYRPAPQTGPLPGPVRCYHGRQDALVDRADLAGWEAVGCGSFSLLEREGSHFHLLQDPERLLADILAFIDAVLDSDSLTRS